MKGLDVNNMNKSKEIVKFIFKSLLILPIAALIGPFLELDFDIIANDLFTTEYWLFCGVMYIVGMPTIIYFKYINPRKFVAIDCHIPLGRIIVLSLIIPIAIFIILPLTIICETLIIKIILFIVFLLSIPTTVYLILHGIYVYREKDILVYNHRFKYYKNAIINEIEIENQGKYSNIIIVINNEENKFKVVSKKVSKFLEEIQFIKIPKKI
jgi:hypothetical protein